MLKKIRKSTVPFSTVRAAAALVTAFALILAFALAYALPCCAASAEMQGGSPVRVAYFDMGDYYTVDSTGAVQSFDSAALEKIAQYSGLRFSYINCGTWSNALAMLEQGEVDLVGTAQWTRAREDAYEFCLESYGYTVGCLASLGGRNIVYEDYAAISRCTVGCTENYVRRGELDALLAAQNITPEIKTYDNQEQLENALLSGEIDLMAANSHTLHDDWNIVEKFSYTPFYFISQKGNTTLTDAIDNAIIQANLREPLLDDELMQQYFPNILGEPLTKAERELIAEDQTYTVYFRTDCKPVAWYDAATDTVCGAFADACAQITESTGLKLVIRPLAEQDDTKDALVCYTTLFYNSGFDSSGEPGVTNAIMDEPFNLFHKVGRDMNLSQPGMSIAVVGTLGRLQIYVQEKYPGCSVVSCASPQECVEQLEAGKVDLAFMNVHVADNVLTELALEDIHQLPIDDTPLGFALTFSGTDGALLSSIVNKGILKLDTAALSDAMVQYALETAPEVSWRTITQSHPGWIYGFMGVLGVVVALIAGLTAYAYAMRKQRDRVEKADAGRTEFFARMSHDMRTPINGILGMIRLTREMRELPQPAVENLKKAESAGIYMLSLINDTLDLQRLESKRMEFNPEIVYAREFFEDIFAIQRMAAEEKSIDFRIINRNMQLDKYIEIDKIRVRQIFANLISNAIKFTPDGGIVELIMECLGPDESGMVSHKKFIFHDTGVGMSKEFIENSLYKAYAQENNRMTSQKPGTGLGLAIVKNLLDAMGGRIEVESTPGQGTTFTVWMDFKNVPDEVAAQHEKEAREKAGRVEYDLAGRRVLLCEDHPLNAEITRRLLQKVGCEVVWAENGRLGVDAFNASDETFYDVVLMDIRMPVMDGLEAARAIRALPRRDAQCVPIIALTANAYDADIQSALEAGMNAHLAKPVEPAHLFETIAAYLK